MKRTPAILFVSLVAMAVGGCSSTSTQPASSAAGGSGSGVTSSSTPGSQSQDTFPSVIKAVPSRAADGSWSFDVTMRSPYDSPDRYADGWRIKSGETVFGEMTLGHDHASEQPFTRTQTKVTIPSSVTSVVVEGRDIANGYGGKTVTVQLPG